MAITDSTARFLFFVKSKGVVFSETATLGRLTLKTTPRTLNTLAEKYLHDEMIPTKQIEKIDSTENLLRKLGAATTDSIDFSNYEGATIIHDMNVPIPNELHNKYSLVIDGGTLEHIFNFPVAIKNCMQLLKLGGHFISFAPLNNLMGHGFYQFSPELFYKVFSAQNGFEVCDMFITTGSYYDDNLFWYKVVNPEKIQERVTLTNSQPVYLLLLAKKIESIIPFQTFPNQNDYIEAWKTNTSNMSLSLPSYNKLHRIYRKLLNERIRSKIRKLITAITTTDNLEKLNPNFFRRYKH